jgi:hypothetical protein
MNNPNMDEQQYWDCDKCGARYPYHGGRSAEHGDWPPIKRETLAGEVLYLCDSCANANANAK